MPGDTVELLRLLHVHNILYTVVRGEKEGKEMYRGWEQDFRPIMRERDLEPT